MDLTKHYYFPPVGVNPDIVQSFAFTLVAHSGRSSESEAFSHEENPISARSKDACVELAGVAVEITIPHYPDSTRGLAEVQLISGPFD